MVERQHSFLDRRSLCELFRDVAHGARVMTWISSVPEWPDELSRGSRDCSTKGREISSLGRSVRECE